jgi:threonine synthase
MVGYQAAGAAPFVKGKMIDNPETIATAIRIGHPQSWDLGSFCLIADHSGGVVGFAFLMIFCIPYPVGGNIACITDW